MCPLRLQSLPSSGQLLTCCLLEGNILCLVPYRKYGKRLSQTHPCPQTRDIPWITLGLHRTSHGLAIHLQANYGQNCIYLKVGQQDLNFILCCLPECRWLPQNTRSNSVVLVIEIDKIHDFFQPLKTVGGLVNFDGEWPTRSWMHFCPSQISRNSPVGFVYLSVWS